MRSRSGPTLVKRWATPAGATAVARRGPHALAVDLELGAARVHDEQLRVGVTMQRRARARRAVDHEQRDRKVAMVGADEHAGVVRAAGPSA